ncbi:hypothetical protein [Rhizobium favelukesii]|uniref:hypothetical protein n=1 Tax=Rhizobium favelukesii TaxID=348824 RepID=UPI00041A83DD|nr:hypothetical protein [Rhizobium favelukesii]
MTENRNSPTKLIAADLGIGWQTGLDLTIEMSPIAASANMKRNWNGRAKNLATAEFMLYGFRISSGEGEQLPPALSSLWPGHIFSLVASNEVMVVIPTGSSTAVFPRNIYSARGLTFDSHAVAGSFSGKTFTLPAPATEPVRVYARLQYEVIVWEPWRETYREAQAQTSWQLYVEELGGI